MTQGFDRGPFNEFTDEEVIDKQKKLSTSLMKHLGGEGDLVGVRLLLDFLNLLTENEMRMLEAEITQQMIDHAES